MNKYIGKVFIKDNVKYTVTEEKLLKKEITGTPEVSSFHLISLKIDKDFKNSIRDCSTYGSFIHQFEIMHNNKRCILEIKEFSYINKNKDLDMDAIEDYIDNLLEDDILKEKIISDLVTNKDGSFTKNRFLELKCVSKPKKNGEYPFINYYAIGVDTNNIVYNGDFYYIPLTIEYKKKTFKRKTPLDILGFSSYSHIRKDGKEVIINVTNIPSSWNYEDYMKHPQFLSKSFIDTLEKFHKDISERENIVENIPMNRKKEFIKKSYGYKEYIPLEFISEKPFVGWKISFKPEYIEDKIVLNLVSDILRGKENEKPEKLELLVNSANSTETQNFLNKKLYYKNFLCSIEKISKDKIILKKDINSELFEINNKYEISAFYRAFVFTNKFAEKYMQIEYPFLKDKVKDDFNCELLSIPKNIDFIRDNYGLDRADINDIQEFLDNPIKLNYYLDKLFLVCYHEDSRSYGFEANRHHIKLYKNLQMFLFNSITDDINSNIYKISNVILAFEDISLNEEKVFKQESIESLSFITKYNGFNKIEMLP